MQRPAIKDSPGDPVKFWREVGRRMNILQIPTAYDEFERFNLEYERAQFRFAETTIASDRRRSNCS